MLELFREALERGASSPAKSRGLPWRIRKGCFISGAQSWKSTLTSTTDLYRDEVPRELKDVEWLDDVAKIFANVLSRKIKGILVAFHVDKDALERAKELDIDVIYGRVLE